MRYKLRVFHINTNEEAIKVSEVFDSKEAAGIAIEDLKVKYHGKYDYIMLPIK